MGADRLLSYAVALFTNVSVLLLLSLGLGVIFGMRGIINLAHGEFVMLGAYLTLTLTRAHFPLAVAVPVAAALVGVFGIAIERLVIQWLYDRLADCMIATWGLSLILTQAVVLIYGTTTEGIPTPLGSVQVGVFSFAVYNLLLIGLAALALLATLLVMRRTRYGLLARATTQSSTMAAGLGVNTAAVNMWAFGFGSLLSGFAGAVLAPFLGVAPTLGQNVIAKVFMTVIVGGPDFIVGTASAAGALGTVENVFSTTISPVIGQVALLLVAIVIVRVRPLGLTGGRQV